MRRGIDNPFAIRKEKPAGRSALAAVQKLHVATVNIHAKDLIALVWRASGLENDFSSIRRKVRLGILTAKRELSHVN
jgi:hypothetical protein